MTNGRCLGLLGGLGVGATVHYYQTLASAHQQRSRILDIVITHSDTARVFEYVQAADAAGMAQYLNGFLLRLQAAGARFAVIPAVTPLFCLDELLAISPLPLISMVDAVAAKLAAQRARRVAIFGTRYVVESSFYGLLSKVEVVRPSSPQIDLIHSIYTELLRDGVVTDEQRRQLTQLAHTLQQEQDVDHILLAGTDLALIFNQKNTRFPHIDCAAVHLEAIVQTILASPGEPGIPKESATPSP